MTDAATHFTAEAEGEPTGPGRYVRVDEVASAEFVPGLTFRPVLGDGVGLCDVRWDAGLVHDAAVPLRQGFAGDCHG